jgi:mRNA interferase RelE/StbE
MSYTWAFTEKSESQFKKLDRPLKKRVVSKLDWWCKNDKPLDFAETLINSELGSYRFRMGDYRIIFDIEDHTIIVLAIGHRREIYK